MPGWALAGALALVVAGIAVLAATGGERKEGAMGQHSWIDDRDVDDSDGDAALLAVVTGLGEQREPDEQAHADAARLDRGQWPDLRGDRDLDEADLREVRVEPVDEKEDVW